MVNARCIIEKDKYTCFLKACVVVGDSEIQIGWQKLWKGMRYKALWEDQGKAQLNLDLGFREGFLQEGTDKLKLEGRLGEQYSSNKHGRRLRECMEQKQWVWLSRTEWWWWWKWCWWQRKGRLERWTWSTHVVRHVREIELYPDARDWYWKLSRGQWYNYIYLERSVKSLNNT